MKYSYRSKAIVLSVIVLILIIFGLFMNGWGEYTTEDQHYNHRTRVGLLDYTIEENENDFIIHGNWKSRDTNFYLAGIITFVILSLAVVFCIASIAFSVLKRLKNRHRRLDMQMSFITAAMIFLAVTLWTILTHSMGENLEKFHFGWVYYSMILSVILQVISAKMLLKYRPMDIDGFTWKEIHFLIKMKKPHIKRFLLAYITGFVIIIIFWGIFSNDWARKKGSEVNTRFGLHNVHTSNGWELTSDLVNFDGAGDDDEEVYRAMDPIGQIITVWLVISIIVLLASIGAFLGFLLKKMNYQIPRITGIVGGGMISTAPVIWYYLLRMVSTKCYPSWTFFIIIFSGIFQIIITSVYFSRYKKNLINTEPGGRDSC